MRPSEPLAVRNSTLFPRKYRFSGSLLDFHRAEMSEKLYQGFRRELYHVFPAANYLFQVLHEADLEWFHDFRIFQENFLQEEHRFLDDYLAVNKHKYQENSILEYPSD